MSNKPPMKGSQFEIADLITCTFVELCVTKQSQKFSYGAVVPDHRR
jgi:hypothetical protein